MRVFRLGDRLKYLLERWIQRGALTQLLFIAGIIVLISVIGGIAAWLFSDQFEHVGHAIWWAFLRLSDPGYLGDDEGLFLRTVSTIVTVLGYVLFLGSLVAILTQWLNETMDKLESGLTPIAIRDHVLILGWTNRTPTIVQELMLSEGRVRRFLRRRGARKLRVVILAENVTAALSVELREAVGSRAKERRVILRSGTSLRIEHLRRVAYRHASVIIIPGADFLLGGATGTDARVIKTLISLSPPEMGRGPAVVAEVFDAVKTPVAENAYRGGDIDVIASDSFISRLIAQNVRHRGLSYLYSELLSHSRGNEVYIRSFPEWAGRRFGEIAHQFTTAIPLGVTRPVERQFDPHLNPDPDFELRNDDRLVFIARSYEDCMPGADTPSPDLAATAVPAGSEAAGAPRRVLVLGWSHKVISLISEFASYTSETFQIDVLSLVDIDERISAMESEVAPSNRLHLRQLHGDYTIRDTLISIDPMSYDNVIFLASDWMDNEEESDARTILGYVLLRSILDIDAHRPEVLIELMDPENARLLRRRRGEVIISPMILSHILAHVALRRELSAVFTELFGPGGAEFFFRPATDYQLGEGPADINALRAAARERGEIALGVRLGAEFARLGGGVYLNPNPQKTWRLSSEDEIIVLAIS